MTQDRNIFLPYLLTDERLAEYEVDEDHPIVVHAFFDLKVVYLWVTDRGFSFVTLAEVEEMGLSDPVAIKRAAAQNLGRYANGRARVEPRGAVRGVFMGGNFEASFLVTDFFWEGFLAQHFPNGCVVAFPANDMLALCAPDSSEGIEELRNIVSRTFSGGSDLGSDLLSPDLLLRSGGEWIPYSTTAGKI